MSVARRNLKKDGGKTLAFEPIPGLYAAGADACNLYDDSYMFLLPGNSMGFAVNSGRIAGKEAAAYIRRRS